MHSRFLLTVHRGFWLLKHLRQSGISPMLTLPRKTPSPPNPRRGKSGRWGLWQDNKVMEGPRSSHTLHYVRLQQASSVQPEVLLEPDRVTPVFWRPDSHRTVKNALLLLSYLVYGYRLQLQHPSTYPKLGCSQSTLKFLKFYLVSIKWHNTTPGNRLLSNHFCSWFVCFAQWLTLLRLLWSQVPPLRLQLFGGLGCI